MSKFIALFGITIISFLTGVFVMIKGWGLTPDNWWFIILGFIVHLILLTLTQIISEK